MLSYIDKMFVELVYGRICPPAFGIEQDHFFAFRESIEYYDIVVEYRLVEVVAAFRPILLVLEPLDTDAYSRFQHLSTIEELFGNDLSLLQRLNHIVVDQSIVYDLSFLLKLFDKRFFQAVCLGELLWREPEDRIE